MITEQIKKESVDLLCSLIRIESFSKYEENVAAFLGNYLQNKSYKFQQIKNNIYIQNVNYKPELPTILLNSHLDTVRPSASYSRDPYDPMIEEGKLYGLGSNDAGASLVALLGVFILNYSRRDLNYNLIFAATAEEEISGSDGISLLLPHLGNIDFGIVGEPTGMKICVAEKGLIVLDCAAYGRAGHAAREEGENAIYKAIKDIEWFRNYKFPKISKMLGEVKMNVTMIQSGSQHNVVPDTCRYVVDIRSTDMYSNQDIMDIIKLNVTSEVEARSLRLNSSGISEEHFIHKIARELNFEIFGSPTLSDQALMHFPTIKCGPGNSKRSHSADEFVFIYEIETAIDRYSQILESMNNYFKNNTD